MDKSAIKGFCFGLTSGVITTLGTIVGLHSGTGSKMVVVGGVLSIAIADSFSDALGIHISEESDKNKTKKEVWMSTVATFISKFIFSLTFILPLMFLEISNAITISIVWGISILCILSYYIARSQKAKPFGVIFEHLFIAMIVIVITHFVGDLVNEYFK